MAGTRQRNRFTPINREMEGSRERGFDICVPYSKGGGDRERYAGISVRGWIYLSPYFIDLLEKYCSGITHLPWNILEVNSFSECDVFYTFTP